MTEVIRDSRSVPLPPEAAWNLLTEWSRAGEWLPGVTDMTADGPTAVGTRLRYTARGKQQESLISAVTPGRSITLTSTQGGIRADYRYTVAPEGAGSTVGLVADVTMSGPVRLLGGVIRGAIAKADGDQLARFAALARP